MKPLPKLNSSAGQRSFNPIPFVLGIILSVGLLYGRLTAIYEQAAIIPALPIAPTPGQDAVLPPRREDADLFERSLAAGLLWLGTDGRIGIAPADGPLHQRYARDHPDLLVSGASPRYGSSHSWDQRVLQLHRALYFSASGRYVRRQIEAFNTRQQVFARIQIQQQGERLIWRDMP